MKENPEALAAAAAKASPPIAVTGMTIAGYPLADWVLVATLLYTLLQIISVVRRMIYQRRAVDADPACADTCPALKKHREGGYIRTRVAAGMLGISALGLAMIAQDEGYTEVASAPLPGDRPTNGFGTANGVKDGERTNPVRAVVRLAKDADATAKALIACFGEDTLLFPHEFDAYNRLAYNVGHAAVCNSTIPAKLKRGDYTAACQTVLDFDGFRDRTKPKIQNPRTGQWEYPRVQVRGLTLRREREYIQCMGDPAQ